MFEPEGRDQPMELRNDERQPSVTAAKPLYSQALCENNMNESEVGKYGSPDIKIAGLQIWVHGYQFEEADNNDDRNWLRVSAHCGANGASVWVSGSYLQVYDIVKLASDAEKLYKKEIKEIEMSPLEPELGFAIKAIDSLGHLELTIEITPDHLSQEHNFKFEIDQSYLPALISQCRDLLELYPCRNQ